MRAFFAVVLLFLPPSVVAKTIVVERATDLQAAADSLDAGDTLILKSGSWVDVRLMLANDGRAEAPITITAEAPGAAIFTGETSIGIGGSHIVLEGLHFKGAKTPTAPPSPDSDARGRDSGALIDFATDDDTYATDSRITNCYFEACNPAEDRRFHWIRMWGHRNRVDHCRFEGQDHSGVTVQVRLHRPDAEHRIDHNYFLDRKPGRGNGYECVQIGQSWASLSRGGCVVENNIFEACDGETEIISSKTGDNLIRGNLFVRSAGTLTIRHGNGTTAQGNVFLGGGKEGAGGIRIIGERHRVTGNYFYEINNYTGGVIAIYMGIPDGPLNGYAAAHDALVAKNIILHSKGNDLYLNAGFGTRNRVVPPERVVIRDNILLHDYKYGPNFGSVAVAGYLPDVRMANNFVNGKELGRPDDTGLIHAELSLVKQPNGLFAVRNDESGELLPLDLPTLPEQASVGVSWVRTSVN